MISVDEALQNLFDLAPDLAVEHVPLARAGGRILAQPCHARRMQPPFAASAMDGYALDEGAAQTGASFEVIGVCPRSAHFASRKYLTSRTQPPDTNS